MGEGDDDDEVIRSLEEESDELSHSSIDSNRRKRNLGLEKVATFGGEADGKQNDNNG